MCKVFNMASAIFVGADQHGWPSCAVEANLALVACAASGLSRRYTEPVHFPTVMVRRRPISVERLSGICRPPARCQLRAALSLKEVISLAQRIHAPCDGLGGNITKWRIVIKRSGGMPIPEFRENWRHLNPAADEEGTFAYTREVA